MAQQLSVSVNPGKNAGVANYTGHTILWFAFDFTNAKTITLVNEAFEWISQEVPSQPWDATDKQFVADVLLEYVVLYGWRRAHNDVNPPTPPDPINFESDS